VNDIRESSSASVMFHRLGSVSIIGGFLDGQRFDLSDGLNCVIGARGTGKTTVLEFVRYAMDALPADVAARRRVEALVEKNLAGGRIEVAVRTKDGLLYIVSRSAGNEPVVLDDRRNPIDISLRSGGLFNVDIFSQNEVEAIADQHQYDEVSGGGQNRSRGGQLKTGQCWDGLKSGGLRTRSRIRTFRFILRLSSLMAGGRSVRLSATDAVPVSSFTADLVVPSGFILAEFP